MTLLLLARHRMTLILMAVIPAVFLSVVAFTASGQPIPFRLASLPGEVFVEVSQRALSFAFFAVASAGFLVSFLAMNLLQKDKQANRRLIICGHHPLEILAAKLLALLLMVVLIACYVGFFTHAFTPIRHLPMFLVGLVLIGAVYGCYGLIVGGLVDGELEGILLIVLLTNIDAGWLQNPQFYAEAQNQVLIRWLPAYYPSQVAIIAAFTDHSSAGAGLYSLLYGGTLLMVACIVFYYKMRIKR